MTENQWPQTATPATLDQDGHPPAGTLGGSPSKSDAVKGEASQVASEATAAAKDVAQTAKTEASNVAAEVKTNARDLLQQAKSDLTSQAGTQQQKVADGIRSISSELRTMADASNQAGVASDLIREAADRSQSVASWLDGRDPASLITEIKSFARQRPGTFLLLAAGAGVLAGRLTKSLTASAPEAHSLSTPPRRPAAVPQSRIRQETVFAVGDDRGLFEEPTISGGPMSTQALPSGTAADTPLREEDDPFRNTTARDTEGPHL